MTSTIQQAQHYIDSKKYDEAAFFLSKALKTGGMSHVQLAKINVLLGQSRYCTMVPKVTEKILSVVGSHELGSHIGPQMSTQLVRECVAAQTYFLRAIQCDAKNADAKFWLGKCYEYEKQEQAAFDQYCLAYALSQSRRNYNACSKLFNQSKQLGYTVSALPEMTTEKARGWVQSKLAFNRLIGLNVLVASATDEQAVLFARSCAVRMAGRSILCWRLGGDNHQSVKKMAIKLL